MTGPAFLRDGTEVWVREAQEEDRPLLAEFLARASAEALASTVFPTSRPELGAAEVAAASRADEALGLLVLGDRAGGVAVLGLGRYAREEARGATAEVTFLVDDAYRDRGIPMLLLARLARAARAFGIRQFEARVRPDNPGMLEVFRTSGFPIAERPDADEVAVLVPIGSEPDPSASPRPAGSRVVTHRPVRRLED